MRELWFRRRRDDNGLRFSQIAIARKAVGSDVQQRPPFLLVGWLASTLAVVGLAAMELGRGMSGVGECVGGDAEGFEDFASCEL